MKSVFLTGSAKGGLASLVVAALLPCVLSALGRSHGPICKPTYEVSGHVSVWQASDAIREDLSGVVVWLAPLQPGQDDGKSGTATLPYDPNP